MATFSARVHLSTDPGERLAPTAAAAVVPGDRATDEREAWTGARLDATGGPGASSTWSPKRRWPRASAGSGSASAAGWRSGTTRPPMRGRVALVTGATSGIGLATATALAGLGADVHLVGRDPARGAAALRHGGGCRRRAGPGSTWSTSRSPPPCRPRGEASPPADAPRRAGPQRRGPHPHLPDHRRWRGAHARHPRARPLPADRRTGPGCSSPRTCPDDQPAPRPPSSP